MKKDNRCDVEFGIKLRRAKAVTYFSSVTRGMCLCVGVFSNKTHRLLVVYDLPFECLEDLKKIKSYTALVCYAKENQIKENRNIVELRETASDDLPCSRPPETSLVDVDGDTPIYTFDKNNICTCCGFNPVVKFDYCPSCYEDITGNELDSIMRRDYDRFIYDEYDYITDDDDHVELDSKVDNGDSIDFSLEELMLLHDGLDVLRHKQSDDNYGYDNDDDAMVADSRLIDLKQRILNYVEYCISQSNLFKDASESDLLGSSFFSLTEAELLNDCGESSNEVGRCVE